MAEETQDKELAAIKTLLDTLAPLKPESRNNVIEYVFRRLGITAPAAPTPAPLALPPDPPESHPPPAGTPYDLRTLTEQKQPKTAIQMLAIVGYYLAHLAPANERRDYIVADDIKQYFRHANFELPRRSDQTLVNAKNAGYFDIIDTGRYRLNSVGHNLVTHKLPHEGAPTVRTRRVRKAVAKKGKKKANT